jgi:hypothetical protein
LFNGAYNGDNVCYILVNVFSLKNKIGLKLTGRQKRNEYLLGVLQEWLKDVVIFLFVKRGCSL